MQKSGPAKTGLAGPPPTPRIYTPQVLIQLITSHKYINIYVGYIVVLLCSS